MGLILPVTLLKPPRVMSVIPSNIMNIMAKKYWASSSSWTAPPKELIPGETYHFSGSIHRDSLVGDALEFREFLTLNNGEQFSGGISTEGGTS